MSSTSSTPKSGRTSRDGQATEKPASRPPASGVYFGGNITFQVVGGVGYRLIRRSGTN